MTEKKRCKELTKRGKPCKAPVQPSGYCFMHDPALLQQRNAARSQGGRRTGMQIPKDIDSSEWLVSAAREAVELVMRSDSPNIRELLAALTTYREAMIYDAEYGSLRHQVENMREVLVEKGMLT